MSVDFGGGASGGAGAGRDFGSQTQQQPQQQKPPPTTQGTGGWSFYTQTTEMPPQAQPQPIAQPKIQPAPKPMDISQSYTGATYSTETGYINASQAMAAESLRLGYVKSETGSKIYLGSKFGTGEARERLEEIANEKLSPLPKSYGSYVPPTKEGKYEFAPTKEITLGGASGKIPQTFTISPTSMTISESSSIGQGSYKQTTGISESVIDQFKSGSFESSGRMMSKEQFERNFKPMTPEQINKAQIGFNLAPNQAYDAAQGLKQNMGGQIAMETLGMEFISDIPLAIRAMQYGKNPSIAQFKENIYNLRLQRIYDEYRLSQSIGKTEAAKQYAGSPAIGVGLTAFTVASAGIVSPATEVIGKGLGTVFAIKGASETVKFSSQLGKSAQADVGFGLGLFQVGVGAMAFRGKTQPVPVELKEVVFSKNEILVTRNPLKQSEGFGSANIELYGKYEARGIWGAKIMNVYADLVNLGNIKSVKVGERMKSTAETSYGGNLYIERYPTLEERLFEFSQAKDVPLSQRVRVFDPRRTVMEKSQISGEVIGTADTMAQGYMVIAGQKVNWLFGSDLTSRGFGTMSEGKANSRIAEIIQPVSDLTFPSQSAEVKIMSYSRFISGAETMPSSKLTLSTNIEKIAGSFMDKILLTKGERAFDAFVKRKMTAGEYERYEKPKLKYKLYEKLSNPDLKATSGGAEFSVGRSIKERPAPILKETANIKELGFGENVGFDVNEKFAWDINKIDRINLESFKSKPFENKGVWEAEKIEPTSQPLEKIGFKEEPKPERINLGAEELSLIYKINKFRESNIPETEIIYRTPEQTPEPLDLTGVVSQREAMGASFSGDATKKIFSGRLPQSPEFDTSRLGMISVGQNLNPMQKAGQRTNMRLKNELDVKTDMELGSEFKLESSNANMMRRAVAMKQTVAQESKQKEEEKVKQETELTFPNISRGTSAPPLIDIPRPRRFERRPIRRPERLPFRPKGKRGATFVPLSDWGSITQTEFKQFKQGRPIKATHPLINERTKELFRETTLRGGMRFPTSNSPRGFKGSQSNSIKPNLVIRQPKRRWF